MIRCKFYKKIIKCGNIYLVIALWTDIFIAYISSDPISTFLRQFYSGNLANFAGSTIIFFFIAALTIPVLDGPGCCSSWGISLLTTVPNWYLSFLFLSSQIFSVLFCGNKYYIAALYCAFLGIVLESFFEISSQFNG